MFEPRALPRVESGHALGSLAPGDLAWQRFLRDLHRPDVPPLQQVYRLCVSNAGLSATQLNTFFRFALLLYLADALAGRAHLDLHVALMHRPEPSDDDWCELYEAYQRVTVPSHLTTWLRRHAPW